MRVSTWRVLVVRSFVALCLFGSAGPLAAQTTAGVKVGLNVSSLEYEPAPGDSELDGERETGASAGVFILREMGQAFGVQVEGLISQKGGSFEDGILENRLTYLDIPVLASYRIGPSAGPSVRLMAGPTIGILLSDTQKVGGDELEGDDNLEFGSADLGLTLGGALEVNRLTFDVRYTHGFVNVIDDDRVEGTAYRNRTFTVSLGWRFR